MLKNIMAVKDKIMNGKELTKKEKKLERVKNLLEKTILLGGD